MGFITAAIAIVGGAMMVSSMHQQKKQAKNAARIAAEQNRVAQGQAAIENRARRAKLLRQAQMSRAVAENVQATQGGGGATTTMATGALATANTQQAVNLANFGEMGRLGRLSNNLSLASGIAQGKANNAAAMGQFGQFLMGNAGTFGSQISGTLKSMGSTGGGGYQAPTYGRGHPGMMGL